MFWLLGQEACWILAPWSGMEVIPPTLEILITGLPGKSQHSSFHAKRLLYPDSIASNCIQSRTWWAASEGSGEPWKAVSVSGYLWSSNPWKSSDTVPRAWSPVSRSKTAIEACNQYPPVCPKNRTKSLTHSWIDPCSPRSRTNLRSPPSPPNSHCSRLENCSFK